MTETTAPKITIDLRVTLDRAAQLERALAVAAASAPDDQVRAESRALLGWLRGRIARRSGLLR